MTTTFRGAPRALWGVIVIVVLMVSAALVAAPGGADAANPAGPTSDVPDPAIDVTGLDPVPVAMWGVSGQDPESTQTPTFEVLVWDFQQIGNRMFVGGAFLNVQESRFSTPIPQRSVAAFDVATGEWISSWRPQLDRAVYSLGLSPSGSLLVGGEFETVNGEARAGLVALDPITGDIDPRFEGSVDRPWSSRRAQVRQIRVVDDQIYVAGNFSHLNGVNGSQTRAFRVGRFIGPSGALDENWKPEVTGSGVWGMAIDPDRGRVHLTGYFSGVNGEADTGYFHTVDDRTGASITGLAPRQRNLPEIQPEMYDVVVGDDLVVLAGEQHLVQILDAADHTMVGYHHTGLTGDRFEIEDMEEIFAGGAFQVTERIGNVIFAGCHCTFSVRDGLFSHFSSFTQKRTPHRLIMAYDATTGRLIEDFLPDVHSPQDGVWAVGSDTNGCLYVGGDLHVGGVDHQASRWLGGFGKLCPRLSAPTAGPGLSLGSRPGCITLTGSFWAGSTESDGLVLGTDDVVTIRDLETGATENYGPGSDTRCLPAGTIAAPGASAGSAFEPRYELTWPNLAQQRAGERRGQLPVIDTSVVPANGQSLPSTTVTFSRLVTGSLPVGTVHLPSGDADGDGLPNGAELLFLSRFRTSPITADAPALYAASDIDGDGIPDSSEPGFPSQLADVDGDAAPNWADRDANGDGIDDRGDTAESLARSFNADVDGDGIPNWLDANPLVAGALGDACSIPTPNLAYQSRVATQARAAQVWRLYSAMFLRQPDEAGFDYWLGVRDGGYPHASIAGDFERGVEFRSRYGELDDQAFVSQIYANVLCRQPDSSGRSYWLGQLGQGLPRGELVLWFTEGSEYLTRTGTGLPLNG